jgi:hypothetical protein
MRFSLLDGEAVTFALLFRGLCSVIAAVGARVCWSKYKPALRRHTLAMKVVTAALGLLVAPTESQAQFTLGNFVLSNDGRYVAFPVAGTIGLFEWRTGQLTTIVRPPNVKSMGGPAFSTDGKSLAVAINSDVGNIAIFDLATLQAKEFHKSDCWLRSGLVFEPGDGALLYVTGNSPSYLCLYDLKKHSTRIVLKPENGFYSINKPAFLTFEDLLFSGMGPENADLASQVDRLGVNKIAAPVPYRLKFGGVSEIVYRELIRRSLALSKVGASGPISFAASKDGARIAFIDRSSSEDERVKKEQGGYHRYDLFLMEEGRTRQVTNLEAYMSFIAISYDGSTVGFGVYAKPMADFRYEPGKDRSFDLNIIDLNTGTVTKTDLVDRVNASLGLNRHSK